MSTVIFYSVVVKNILGSLLRQNHLNNNTKINSIRHMQKIIGIAFIY